MKHFLLAIYIALLPVVGVCQTATFSFQCGVTDTAKGNYRGGTDLAVTNYIRCVGPDSVRVAWKVLSFALAPNWSVTGLCDNVTCYTNNPVASPPNGQVLNGGINYTDKYGPSFGDFHILFDPTTAADGSSSWVKVNVKDVASTYSRNVTLVGTKNPSGIFTSSTSADDITLYPNPAREAINVIYDEQAGVKTIAVYDLIGKLAGPVYKPSINGSARIDMSEMPNGMYFLRLMDAQGRVLATRRFIRQW